MKQRPVTRQQKVISEFNDFNV